MSKEIAAHFETIDPVLASIVSISTSHEQMPSGHASAYEVLARSIANQQISGLVARKIIERLIALHDGQFPTPAQLAAATPEALRGVGFSFAKIAALKDLAAHCLDGRIPDDATLATLDDETIIERCSAVRGIGRWTVQMLLMFHFGRPDVLPVDDFGVRHGFRLAYGLKGLPRPKALLAYGERWKPHRSAAAWYMWRAIELQREGRLPKRVGRAPRVEIEPPKAAKKTVARSAAKAKAKTKAKVSPARAKTSPAKAGRKAKARKATPHRKLKSRPASRRAPRKPK
jgi:DNA-3-methyladenine glycosylase II